MMDWKYGIEENVVHGEPDMRHCTQKSTVGCLQCSRAGPRLSWTQSDYGYTSGYDVQWKRRLVVRRSWWQTKGTSVFFQLLCCFLACMIIMPDTILPVNSAELLCNEAQGKCIRRMGCGMALHNYMLYCADLIHGDTEECTPQCKRSLISLLSSEEQDREAFLTCNCEDNEFCVRQKSRIKVCNDQVLAEMEHVNDDDTPITCSQAELLCSADTSCLTALDFYNRHCQKLLRGQKCTSRCNNSLSILYRQEKAKKLPTCFCDGTEDYDCPQLRHNTERLCFGRDPTGTSSPRRHHIRHHTRHNHTRTPNSIDDSNSRHRAAVNSVNGTNATLGEDCFKVQLVGTNYETTSSGTSLHCHLVVHLALVLLVTWSLLKAPGLIPRGQWNPAGR